ncbi:MAG: formylglycine-generating enzyme family protein [Oligoflexales bacterium]
MKFLHVFLILLSSSCGERSSELMKNSSNEMVVVDVSEIYQSNDDFDNVEILDRKKIVVDGSELEFVLIPGGVSKVKRFDNEYGILGYKTYWENLDSFWISTKLVDQGLYQKVIGSNPSLIVGDEYPIHNVGYTDAASFIDKINIDAQLNNLDIEFSLPNEFEWLHAVTGGQDTSYYWGNDFQDGADFEWLDYNDDRSGVLHPVATKKPNPYGIYDGIGNCVEFTDLVNPIKNTSGDDMHAVMGAYYLTNESLAESFKQRFLAPKDEGKWSAGSFRLVLKDKKS